MSAGAAEKLVAEFASVWADSAAPPPDVRTFLGQINPVQTHPAPR
jgi:hypothetical protein